MNYIVFAMPIFAIMIIIELVVDAYRKTGYYRLNDSISSLNAGVLSRVNAVFRKLIPLVIYVYIEKNFALVKFEESTALWIIAFVLYDLCYYAYHRYSHEINLLWASHVVHHSSEEYNLTTALRQTSGGLLGWIFYIPLALLGIEPLMLVAVGSLNLLYQFWVHSRHIPKLGYYEWFFVTPSNHRVHHATNDRYIDKNYGGVFILWDRLFNTFTEESDDEPCTYGIRKPLNSWNPVWANLHFYVQLFRDAWHTKNWSDKFRIWFKPTGWRPYDMEEKFPLVKYEQATFKKFDVKIPPINSYYSLAQYILLLVGGFLFFKQIAGFSTYQQLIGGGLIILSCYSIAMIFEGKKWVIGLEYLRYGILIYFAYDQAIPENFLLSLQILAAITLVSGFFIKPPTESLVIS